MITLSSMHLKHIFHLKKLSRESALTLVLPQSKMVTKEMSQPLIRFIRIFISIYHQYLLMSKFRCVGNLEFPIELHVFGMWEHTAALGAQSLSPHVENMPTL